MIISCFHFSSALIFSQGLFHPHRLSFIFMQTIPTCMVRTVHYQPRTEQNRDGCISYIDAQEQPAIFTRPELLARSSACGLRCQIMPGWKSRLHIVLFQEHSPTEPVYTNKRCTVLYLRILIMCVFVNRRCLVIETRSPFSSWVRHD